MKGLATLALLPLALAGVACGEGGGQPATGARNAARSEPLVVYAVNEPLRYFAERIGGEQVRAVLPAPAGVDPAFWSPDAEIVAAYQSADLILLNGAGYAAWVERATLPRRRLVDTSAAFSDRLLPVERDVTHQHGPEGDHSHAAKASTVWLDPSLATEQARAVAAALSRARPTRAGAFAARLAALEADLRALDEELAAAAANLSGAPLVFSHPVYPYLQQRYELNGRSLHWEPDTAPTPEDWAALDAMLARHPARILVWEGEPLEATRDSLEALGLRSSVFAPGAAPSRQDWLSLMRSNAARLRDAAEPRAGS